MYFKGVLKWDLPRLLHVLDVEDSLFSGSGFACLLALCWRERMDTLSSQWEEGQSACVFFATLHSQRKIPWFSLWASQRMAGRNVRFLLIYQIESQIRRKALIVVRIAVYSGQMLHMEKKWTLLLLKELKVDICKQKNHRQFIDITISNAYQLCFKSFCI